MLGALIVALLALFVYVNTGRGPVAQTSKLIDNNEFRLFNPSTCRVQNNQILVFRYSNRSFCPNKWLPPRNDEFIKIQTSYILIYFTHLSITAFLDTSSLGFAHYEDGRIIALSGQFAAIVFTKYKDKLAKICVAVVEIPSGPTGPTLVPKSCIEFDSEQNQKNWMPRFSSGALYLHVSLEKNIVFVVPNIETLNGYVNVSVPKIPLSKWRGSSPIIDTPWGQLGIVHYRRPQSLKKKLLPDYVHAFFLLDEQGTTVFREFEVNIIDLQGFTYLTGFDVQPHGLIVYSGVTDCYSVSFLLSNDYLKKNILIESTQCNDSILEINVPHLEIY